MTLPVTSLRHSETSLFSAAEPISHHNYRAAAHAPDTTCFPPEVRVFGGRGKGARARAVIGDYTASTDARTVSTVTGGVVAVEVLDGGEGYSYPPFIQFYDNCGLGIGAEARAVIENGKVKEIYVVQPGENYPSYGEDLLVVDSVTVVDGGSGYDSWHRW